MSSYNYFVQESKYDYSAVRFFEILEILSGIGEACGIGEDHFMGTCYSGLSCNHGLCNITCNIRIHE